MRPYHRFLIAALVIAAVPVFLAPVWLGVWSFTEQMMITLVVAAVPVNAYPLVYATRPWYITGAGRALMVKAVGNMILIDLALATAMLGQDYPGRDVFRAVGFTVFTIGVWYLFVVLLKTGRSRAEVDRV